MVESTKPDRQHPESIEDTDRLVREVMADTMIGNKTWAQHRNKVMDNIRFQEMQWFLNLSPVDRQTLVLFRQVEFEFRQAPEGCLLVYTDNLTAQAVEANARVATMEP